MTPNFKRKSELCLQGWTRLKRRRVLFLLYLYLGETRCWFWFGALDVVFTHKFDSIRDIQNVSGYDSCTIWNGSYFRLVDVIPKFHTSEDSCTWLHVKCNRTSFSVVLLPKKTSTQKYNIYMFLIGTSADLQVPPAWFKKLMPRKNLSNDPNFELSGQISIVALGVEFVWDFEQSRNSDKACSNKAGPCFQKSSCQIRTARWWVVDCSWTNATDRTVTSRTWSRKYNLSCSELSVQSPKQKTRVQVLSTGTNAIFWIPRKFKVLWKSQSYFSCVNLPPELEIYYINWKKNFLNWGGSTCLQTVCGRREHKNSQKVYFSDI